MRQMLLSEKNTSRVDQSLHLVEPQLHMGTVTKSDPASNTSPRFPSSALQTRRDRSGRLPRAIDDAGPTTVGRPFIPLAIGYIMSRACPLHHTYIHQAYTNSQNGCNIGVNQLGLVLGYDLSNVIG